MIDQLLTAVANQNEKNCFVLYCKSGKKVLLTCSMVGKNRKSIYSLNEELF